MLACGLKPYLLVAVLSWFFTQPVFAQALFAEDEPSYIAKIELHTAAELYAALQRSEQLFKQEQQPLAAPVAFVLHGAEAQVFFRQHYQQNQALVDLAAKLSAFKLVDIKVCKTWMAVESLDEAQLLPFIGTVPFGPVEEQRLLKLQGYSYF